MDFILDIRNICDIVKDLSFISDNFKLYRFTIGVTIIIRIIIRINASLVKSYIKMKIILNESLRKYGKYVRLT